ncbi:hypothetical protein MRX96_049082 [Rhipicephalus microplus]
MGSKTNSTQMFPPDALCDYILFDSLYKGYTNPLLAPSGLDASLATFVDAYATYYTTAFGVGIAYSILCCYTHYRIFERCAFLIDASDTTLRFCFKTSSKKLKQGRYIG